MTQSKYKSVAEEVTVQIIALLEKGDLRWLRGWQVSAAPHNGESGRLYTGANVLMLRLAASRNGWSDPRWYTWNGLQRLGGHVRKGEHYSPAVFWKSLTVPDEQRKDVNGEPKVKVVPYMRTYQLFNADQCTRLPKWQAPVMTWQPLERAEAVCRAWPVPVHHGGDQAYYSPQQDAITLPPRTAFESAEAFYAALLHEIAHSTGHPSRLDREFGVFGTAAYAREELVAESRKRHGAAGHRLIVRPAKCRRVRRELAPRAGS